MRKSKKLNHDVRFIPIEYKKYKLSASEFSLNALIAILFLYTVGVVFYKTQLFAVLISSFGFFYPMFKKQKYMLKRKEELRLQFKYALYALSSLLAAGKSVESAFQEVIQDIQMLYPDKKTYISQEFQLINNKVQLGEPIEKALLEFSERADIDDIANFAQVFVSCKRTGGDLIDVIRKTTQMIVDQIEIQQEISIMIAQKRFESNLLGIIPFFIVGFLSFSSPDYMAPLYHNATGFVIMSISLLFLIFCFWLTQKIMNIKV